MTRFILFSHFVSLPYKKLFSISLKINKYLVMFRVVAGYVVSIGIILIPGGKYIHINIQGSLYYIIYTN